MEFLKKICAKIQCVINNLEMFLCIVLVVEYRKWKYVDSVGCITGG